MSTQVIPELTNKDGGYYAQGPMLNDNEQYSSWRKRFLNHIVGVEPHLKVILETGPFVPKVAGITDGSWINKEKPQWTQDDRRLVNLDARLKSMIITCLPEDVMNSVVDNETAKEVWDDLSIMYEGTEDVLEQRISSLKSDFDTFFSLSTETLTQTHTRFKILLNNLKSVGVEKDNLEIMNKFMNSLPFKWNSFRQILRTNGNLKNLKLPSLFGAFLFEEQNSAKLAKLEQESRRSSSSVSSTAFVSQADFLENPIDNQSSIEI